MVNSIIEQLYDNINAKFTTSNTQLFQMEFPCRLLDQGTYDYPGSDSINAQQFKPQVVAEAEFRLSDDMYDVYNLMGGPNSKQVSAAYAEILGQLVPTGASGDAANVSTFYTDQNNIESWLLEPVPNYDAPAEDILANVPTAFQRFVPPNPVANNGIPVASAARQIPRVDLYQKLADNYEAQRLRWIAFKSNARPDQLTASAETIDDYNRMLASFAIAVDMKLEALWTMLLVRGQYHRVRRMIGFLDVESSSEVLQTARQNLRASVLRSIDDTEDVYPVYFEPANWASFLSTSFQPMDLLTTADSMRDTLLEKQKLKGILLQRLAAVQGLQVDVPTLEDQESAARTAYFDARNSALSQFADNAKIAIELYFSAETGGATNFVTAQNIVTKLGTSPTAPTDLDSALAASNAPPLLGNQFATLCTAWANTIALQSTMQEAGDALLRAQMNAAAARGNDQTALIQSLQAEIQSLQQDIEYLTSCLQGSTNATGFAIKDDSGTTIKTVDPAIPATLTIPPQLLGASSWTTIVDNYTYSKTLSSSFQTTFSKNANFSANLLFGGAFGDTSDSQSNSASHFNEDQLSIDIGFRVMKVEMERPWLDASLFDQTPEFFRGNLTQISAAPPTNVKKALSLGGDITKIPLAEGDSLTPSGPPAPSEVTTTTTLDSVNESLLPSWPTAFLVVKDVHLIFRGLKTNQNNMASDWQKQADSGGSFLCFSCGISEGSSDHRTAAAVTSDAESVSVIIPAPQIIGWISELCPMDKSQTSYTSIGSSELTDDSKSASPASPASPATPVNHAAPAAPIGPSK